MGVHSMYTAPRFESIHLSFQRKMPELPGSGCVVADVPAAAAAVPAAAASVVGEVPEIAASAVLVASEELPVDSDVVKVRILNYLSVVRIRTFWYYYDFEAVCVWNRPTFFYIVFLVLRSPSPVGLDMQALLYTRQRDERGHESKEPQGTF
jgi:hypothetical protein